MPLEKSPALSDKLILRSIAGLRPFRKSGFRIELEWLQNKVVIHNYGHGGAGVTMCWGSAMEVVDLATKDAPDLAQACVIGAGVIGLTTALLLAQSGYKVRVCSDRFTPQTTSDVAGGRWAPTLVEIGDSSEQREMFNRILRRSYDKFLELIDQPYGVFRRTSYVEAGTDASFYKIPEGILPPHTSVAQLPFDGCTVEGDVYETLMIEPPIFMPKLMEDCDSAGITLEEKRFESIEQILKLPEQLIVNCTGLGAGKLFEDADVIPVRGQLVLMQPQDDLPWMVSQRNGYAFPRKDSLVLGGTVEPNEYEATATPEGIAAILKGNREFFGLPNE